MAGVNLPSTVSNPAAANSILLKLIVRFLK
jgi:hypothetical protein